MITVRLQSDAQHLFVMSEQDLPQQEKKNEYAAFCITVQSLHCFCFVWFFVLYLIESIVLLLYSVASLRVRSEVHLEPALSSIVPIPIKQTLMLVNAFILNTTGTHFRIVGHLRIGRLLRRYQWFAQILLTNFQFYVNASLAG